MSLSDNEKLVCHMTIKEQIKNMNANLTSLYNFDIGVLWKSATLEPKWLNRFCLQIIYI